MSAHYTEINYENAVLQLFQERLGYAYTYGPDMGKAKNVLLFVIQSSIIKARKVV